MDSNPISGSIPEKTTVPILLLLLNNCYYRKPATIHKYASINKGFFDWCGKDFDLKIKIPHQMPDEDALREESNAK